MQKSPKIYRSLLSTLSSLINNHGLEEKSESVFVQARSCNIACSAFALLVLWTCLYSPWQYIIYVLFNMRFLHLGNMYFSRWTRQPWFGNFCDHLSFSRSFTDQTLKQNKNLLLKIQNSFCTWNYAARNFFSPGQNRIKKVLIIALLIMTIIRCIWWTILVLAGRPKLPQINQKWGGPWLVWFPNPLAAFKVRWEPYLSSTSCSTLDLFPLSSGSEDANFEYLVQLVCIPKKI